MLKRTISQDGRSPRSTWRLRPDRLEWSLHRVTKWLAFLVTVKCHRFGIENLMDKTKGEDHDEASV